MRKALQGICSATAWLLEELLRGTDKWDPFNSVDAIAPGEAIVPSSGELKVEGLVIWCKGSNGE